MATIPSENFNVNLNNTTYNWANGVLNVSGTAPNQTATYKSQSTNALDVDTTDVGWTVTLSHSGTDYTFVFTGGVFTAGTSGGKDTIGGSGATFEVTPSDDVSADPNDSWSATAN
jgi:hypothetical protein